jgi:hypothetical protein
LAVILNSWANDWTAEKSGIDFQAEIKRFSDVVLWDVALTDVSVDNIASIFRVEKSASGEPT